MKDSHVISEGEVLLAAIRYLLTIEAVPTQISVACGRGINVKSIRRKCKNALADSSVEPQFENSGPDIVAISEDQWWMVECKGAGKGKPATQRNNFDRALASVVSYYGNRPVGVANNVKKSRMFLGLALPDTTRYSHYLMTRVRPPLRKRLNLWVLLYERATRKIRAIAPDQRYT